MKKKIVLSLAVLLAVSLTGCGVSATAPAASSSAASGAESSAVSTLAEKPTAEQVVEHIQSGKSNWVGRTITCAFDENAKTCVTTIAVDNGRKILDQALASDTKMASFEKTMQSYANYNAEIQQYLTSGGYTDFTCTMIICDSTDNTDVMANIDASNAVTIAK